MERIWDIESDASANFFVGGDFTDSLFVDGISYSGFGAADSFILKYNSGGALQWAKVFGSVAEDSAISVASDPLGNAYISGYFVDTLRVADQTVVSHGGWDIYVLKLDPQGNLLWLRSFGGPLNDIGYGLAVSALGRVYVAGWFADSISYPDGSSIVSAGGSDIFCTALDLQGNYLWSARAGAAGVEYGYQVACDDAGNAYVTGVAGAGSLFGDLSLSQSGMFVCKYNAQGQVQWLAGGGGGAVVNLAVQAASGPGQYGLACGRLPMPVTYGDFSYIPIEASDDAYFAKFDAQTGQWLALSTFGGASADNCKDVDLSSGPVAVFNFEGSAAFGNQVFNSNGERDFVLAYGNPELQFVHAGGEFSEVPSCIKELPGGKIVIAGWHFGSTQLGSLRIDSGSSSNQNAFIACFDPSSGADEALAGAPNPIKLSPNPFASSLTITVEKGGQSPTRIGIYNLRGQQIRTLHADSGSKTENQYTWDGRDQSGKSCSAGIYLIKYGERFRKVILKN